MTADLRTSDQIKSEITANASLRRQYVDAGQWSALANEHLIDHLNEKINRDLDELALRGDLRTPAAV